jgi:lipoate-protein ligase A
VNEHVRLLALGTIPWMRTQALYHALAELMTEDSPDTIILARPQEPYICVGYHQSLSAVIDLAACRAAGLPVVRRRVGGGATYLDHNQQFYQCVFHHKRLPYRVDEVYARLLNAPVAVLRQLGLNAALRDGNEIEVDGLRIAGVGGGRIGEAVVVVGNILLDFDYDLMTRAWRVPSEDFRRLARQAMQRRITTLGSLLPRAVSAGEVQARLAAEYARALDLPVVPGFLTEEEEAKAAGMEAQLVSDEWLQLHSEDTDEPMRALKISLDAYVHAGEVHLQGMVVRGTFFARNEVIEQAILEVDLPEETRLQLEHGLVGVPLKHWREVIEALALIS